MPITTVILWQPVRVDVYLYCAPAPILSVAGQNGRPCAQLITTPCSRMGNGGATPHILILGNSDHLHVMDPGTHWIKGWVGPKTGLDAAKERNIVGSAGNRIPIRRSSSS